MTATTLALVGATGGAGTTRTAIELATIGVRDGRDVTVLDGDFVTQGLGEYVEGRISTDLTALVTDRTDDALTAAAYSPSGIADVDSPARLNVVPAHAPFERVARARTAEAAQAFERRIAEAASGADAVIVDVSPVASNEAIAAVTTVDRVIAVRPASPHGRDALQRLRGRIQDVGASVDATIAVTGTGGALADPDEERDADVVIPATDPAIAAAPTAATGDSAYTQAIASAYADLFGTTLGIDFEEEGLLSRLR
ncbi:ParA family protein [Halorubrum vacuolatum]|uniref:CobQ/CobB/MinD/ParA nucleotide binding domain-containing protein n=1 Tax=Halorubrum vacuolatum TaxID=63740 RepID=A0A238XMX6_HALVU|nr:ParA family protein [Halorubrum vacuolatum]SNR59329.1 hypothetical protein SAMN06264855_11925 [Halorubrum vacuolatum]